MADRPILFSSPMVRALIAGSKTQTRRAINPQPSAGGNLVAPPFRGDGNDLHVQFIESDGLPGKSQRLRYAPGDRLYVREHWRTGGQFDHLAPRDLTPEWAEPIGFVADEPQDRISRTGKFRQAMHMPRWASRITLFVTDVRVERLQDISEADALAEGVTRSDYEYDDGECCATAKEAYGLLCDLINGDGAWSANPWVAAYTFTVRMGNIDQLEAA